MVPHIACALWMKNFNLPCLQPFEDAYSNCNCINMTAYLVKDLISVTVGGGENPLARLDFWSFKSMCYIRKSPNIIQYNVLSHIQGKILVSGQSMQLFSIPTKSINSNNLCNTPVNFQTEERFTTVYDFFLLPILLCEGLSYFQS